MQSLLSLPAPHQGPPSRAPDSIPRAASHSHVTFTAHLSSLASVCPGVKQLGWRGMFLNFLSYPP